MYFADETEARAWLAFEDSTESERENYAWWYPDTFEEWRRWRAAALDSETESGTVLP